MTIYIAFGVMMIYFLTRFYRVNKYFDTDKILIKLIFSDDKIDNYVELSGYLDFSKPWKFIWFDMSYIKCHSPELHDLAAEAEKLHKKGYKVEGRKLIPPNK